MAARRQGVWIVVLFLVSSLPFDTHAQDQPIPEGELAVAYRQLQSGKLSEAVFQSWLECAEGECSLTTLTLGQCIAGAFYPKLQRWTTRRGGLSTSLIAPTVLLAEFREGGALFQLRFTFDSSGPLYDRLRLRDFSGRVVKQSDVLSKTITWELVPLRGISESEVRFQCPASLDFVP